MAVKSESGRADGVRCLGAKVRDQHMGTLLGSASKWAQASLGSWAEDDFAAVALLAPIAVEHLGKAALWELSPALLTPMAQNAEASLLALATAPDLNNPKLRTVGLGVLLERLSVVFPGLPADREIRQLLASVRNGSVHVGSARLTIEVLTDALTICGFLLDELQVTPLRFYGDHATLASELLDKRKSETGRRVAGKRARARSHVAMLLEKLGRDLFEETRVVLEDAFDPENYGASFVAVRRKCPVCESSGHLMGPLDVVAEAEMEEIPSTDGEPEYFAHGYWLLTLFAHQFRCRVCDFSLESPGELAEAELPVGRLEVQEYELGSDFDVEAYVHGRGDYWEATPS